jgi:hypothetical protein
MASSAYLSMTCKTRKEYEVRGEVISTKGYVTNDEEFLSNVFTDIPPYLQHRSKLVIKT